MDTETECTHEHRLWIEALSFDEEGKGWMRRYWTCPDCGKRGSV